MRTPNPRIVGSAFVVCGLGRGGGRWAGVLRGSRIRSRRSSPAAAWMTRMCRSWTSSRTSVPVRVRPTPMWCRRPLTRRVTQPALSILSWRTRSWVSRARSVPGGLGRAGGVGGRGGRAVGQGAVRSVVVVGADEEVEQCLQLGNRARLGGLGWQPFLHRLALHLLKAFPIQKVTIEADEFPRRNTIFDRHSIHARVDDAGRISPLFNSDVAKVSICAIR